MENKVPNPGSEEAIKQGCLCPAIDNHYGRGVPIKCEYPFWVDQKCPLHAKKEE